MAKIIGQKMAWWSALSTDKQKELMNKYYYSHISKISDDMIIMMYDTEHRKVDTSHDHMVWWADLTQKEQLYFAEKYFGKEALLTGGMIKNIYEHVQRINAATKPCNFNSDSTTPSYLDYLLLLNKMQPEQRYDFIACSLFALPLSVDELTAITNILKENKEKNI